MTDPTDNHGYEIPSEGEQNWHEPLNENLRRFETDIEIRDTEATLREYTPKEGAKFLATDTGTVYLGTGSDWTELGSVTSPRVTDRQDARTFDEHDVEVTRANTYAGDGSIGLVTGKSRAVRPPDTRSLEIDERFGIKIQPRVDLKRLEARVSGSTQGIRFAYLMETDGTIIEKTTGRGTASFSFDSPLSSNRSYYLLTGGLRNATIGRYEPRGESDGFPYTSGAVDITAGVKSVSNGYKERTERVYAYSWIDAEPVEITTGRAYVEWPHPDPSEWQTATFRRTLNNGSVEVYVEVSDDDGSSWSDWSGNPDDGIDSGVDLSGVPADSELRFRVEFDRSSTRSKPQLDALSRRWVV